MHLVQYMATTLDFMKSEFGFNKLFAMHQDVLWATGNRRRAAKVAAGKYGWENLGTEVYPTGSSDFSAAQSKQRPRTLK